MSNNISNVNGINPQIPDKGAEKTLFTKEQFTNSIMSALSRAGANKTQKANFQQQAASIFTQYDTSPADNKWTRTESDNGGAQALASFYEMVNNALKGIESPASVDPKTSPEAAKGAEKFNSLTPEQQADAIKQEISEIYASGASIVDFDGETITVRGSDGQEFGISLSQLGLSKETIERLKPVIEETIVAKTFEKAGYGEGDRVVLNQMGIESSMDADGNLTFSNNGEQIGSVKYDESKNPVYDEGAQDINFSMTVAQYEAAGYEVTSSRKDKNDNIVAIFERSDGDKKEVTIDINTGKEIKKQE